MRWNVYEKKDGEFKVKTKFAILPITINNETRWLEKVKIAYRYCWDYRKFEYGRCYHIYGWKKWYFIDDIPE